VITGDQWPTAIKIVDHMFHMSLVIDISKFLVLVLRTT
jgi:hypothetical protein